MPFNNPLLELPQLRKYAVGLNIICEIRLQYEKKEVLFVIHTERETTERKMRLQKKVRNWKISSLLCWIDSYEADRKIPFLKSFKTF